jgi:hypothetical protein
MLTSLSFYRFLLLHKELYKDFCEYASSQFPNGAPDDEKDNHDAVKNVFPSLISILLYPPPIKNAYSKSVQATCQLHLYGTISPSDLVYACRPCPPRTAREEYDGAKSITSEDFEANDSSSVYSLAPPLDLKIDTLVLHRKACLLMAEKDKADYPSRSVIFGCGDSASDGRTLDLRLLEHDDNTQATLDGCVWLFNHGVTGCHPKSSTASSMLRCVEVLCHEELLPPMYATVSRRRSCPLTQHVLSHRRS